jgi:tol-pal system protein YbgF
MRASGFSILLLAATAHLGLAASKEMIELQRDVAQLQDQVRTLQRTLDERVGNLQAMSQQSNDTAIRIDKAIALMQEHFNEALRQQQQTIGGPVAGLGNKLDQVSEDFRTVRETVLDMNQRLGKLDAKIADLQNTINVIRNPPAAPPNGDGGTPGTAGAAPPAPPPGMSAEATYSNAFRDATSGKYDLALQEFSDYVKYYPSLQLAPNAQFYIGDIYMRKKDYEHAIQAFDAVLEQYSDNSKTAAAHLKKGEALMALGRRDAAAREFRDILSRYPDSDVTPRAKANLKDLGLGPAPAAAAAPKKKH